MYGSVPDSSFMSPLSQFVIPLKYRYGSLSTSESTEDLVQYFSGNILSNGFTKQLHICIIPCMYFECRRDFGYSLVVVVIAVIGKSVFLLVYNGSFRSTLKTIEKFPVTTIDENWHWLNTSKIILLLFCTNSINLLQQLSNIFVGWWNNYVIRTSRLVYYCWALSMFTLIRKFIVVAALYCYPLLTLTVFYTRTHIQSLTKSSDWEGARYELKLCASCWLHISFYVNAWRVQGTSPTEANNWKCVHGFSFVFGSVCLLICSVVSLFIHNLLSGSIGSFQTSSLGNPKTNIILDI